MKKNRQIILFILLTIPLQVLSQKLDTTSVKGFCIVHYYQYYPSNKVTNTPIIQGCAYFMDTVNFLHFLKVVNTKRTSDFYYLYNVLDTTNLYYTLISKNYINQQFYIDSCKTTPIEYFDIYSCQIKGYSIVGLRNVGIGFYDVVGDIINDHIKIRLKSNKYTYYYWDIRKSSDFLANFLFRIFLNNPQYYWETRFR